MGIRPEEADAWHAKGWLSFGLSESPSLDEVDDPRMRELAVVRDVVRSGLCDAQVERLLGKLPRPCAVDPSRLAFSFRHGWVEAVVGEDPDPDAILDEHLDEWLESCNEERLRALQHRIGVLLAGCPADAAKDEG